MTDKEKIRKEVERLMTELIQEKEKGFGSDIDDACILELQNVLTYIDSLQEEPVAPKVLEDMLNAKTAAESLGISQEEHDKIVDELIYGKEPELVDVDDLPNKEKEPVSEDLEEACEQLAENARKRKADTSSPFFSQTDYKQGVIDGAEWQKEKEYTCYEEAFEDGTKWKKEQMMKDAVDACVTGIRTYKEDNEVDFTVMYEKGIIPYEIEQEVKLIIIKEY